MGTIGTRLLALAPAPGRPVDITSSSRKSGTRFSSPLPNSIWGGSRETGHPRAIVQARTGSSTFLALLTMAPTYDFLAGGP